LNNTPSEGQLFRDESIRLITCSGHTLYGNGIDFPLAFLGPASIEAILNQQCRPELTLDELCCHIPVEWTEQQQFIAFAENANSARN
jgi:hypothetical protein